MYHKIHPYYRCSRRRSYRVFVFPNIWYLYAIGDVRNFESQTCFAVKTLSVAAPKPSNVNIFCFVLKAPARAVRKHNAYGCF